MSIPNVPGRFTISSGNLKFTLWTANIAHNTVHGTRDEGSIVTTNMADMQDRWVVWVTVLLLLYLYTIWTADFNTQTWEPYREWGNYVVRTRNWNSQRGSFEIFLWGFIMGFFNLVNITWQSFYVFLSTMQTTHSQPKRSYLVTYQIFTFLKN